MPPKSLMELAIMACIKNIKSLESVGDYLPYESVRHILQRVDNAYQLRQIELNSPQLQGETAELWIKLIERDFPLEYKATAYKPQTPDKWHKVWEKYKKEHDADLEDSERKLMSALAGLKEDKMKNTSKIVERKYLPQAGRVGPKRAWGQRDPNGSVLTFNSGSRTKTHTGASVMRKVRREVKEIATIHGSLSKSIRVPTQVGKLSKAPAAMVNDYQRAAKPEYRAAARPSPEIVSAVEQYEKRATFISDSDEEEGEPIAKAPPKPAVTEQPAPARTQATKKRGGLFRFQQASNPVIKKIVPGSSSKQPAQPSASSTQQRRPGSSSSSSTQANPSRATSSQTSRPDSNRSQQRRPDSSSGSNTQASPSGANSSQADKPGSSKIPPRPQRPAGKAPIPQAVVTIDPTSETDDYFPTGRTTSPTDPAHSSMSPQDIVDALEESAPQPMGRKRKAVDIFMRRPKKRAA